MGVQDDMQERTDTALRDFQAQVASLGLWDGVWLAIVGIRSSSGWVCFAFRAILIAPGVTIPPSERLFEATTSDARIRVCRFGLSELWPLLKELTRGSTTSLSAIFGEPITLPVGVNPSLFQFSKGHQSHERVHMLLMRNASVTFHELFGFELFERLGPQLRAHQPPYGGSREVGENLHTIWASSFEQNNANPSFEVSAEVPIAPVVAFFNAAHGAIEIRTCVGFAVPLERLSVSVTPSPRLGLRGDDFQRSRTRDIIELTHLVPSPEPQTEAVVHLQFDDLAIGTTRIRPTGRNMPVLIGARGSSPQQAWVGTLQREFHLSISSLRRRFRAVLSRRVADVAESRIATSVEMREQHPFFSVVSAASVAEVLLKGRLGKVKAKVRRVAWASLRASDARLPKKLQPDLKFDHAIRLATALGILDDIDSQSVDLLRIARNELHLDRDSRPSHEDFSPVRASAAILATLNLGCAMQRRVRRTQRQLPPVPAP